MTCRTYSIRLLPLLTLALAACTHEQVPCAENPDAPGCDPWICCSAPSTEGCDPAEISARCGGVDGGQMDAGDGGGMDAGPCGMACADPTPLCRESDGMCVACLGDGDCDGSTPRCDTTAGECVACLNDTHCTNPAAARCGAGACTGCTDSEQCAGITDAEVCDTDAATCVQCTAVERDACGTNVCDGSTNTCTTRPEDSKGLCQDCVADAECMDGQLCVAMTFESTDVGQFCLWREDATQPTAPMGSCTNTRPYTQGTPITSVDDVTTRVCSLRQTTCPGLNDFDHPDGCTAPVAGDPECGFSGVNDGLCRMRDAVTNRCTIPCLSDDDCLSGSTCNTGATPRYCNF